MSGYEGRWKLCARDIEVLDEVKNFIWTLKSRCETGHQLMGVGAAIVLIETILEGEMPQGFVGFFIEGTDQGFWDDEEANEVSLTLDVGHDEISMGGIEFRDFGFGRDHETTSAGCLTADGGFDAASAKSWLKQASRLKVTQLGVDWDNTVEVETSPQLFRESDHGLCLRSRP